MIDNRYAVHLVFFRRNFLMLNHYISKSASGSTENPQTDSLRLLQNEIRKAGNRLTWKKFYFQLFKFIGPKFIILFHSSDRSSLIGRRFLARHFGCSLWFAHSANRVNDQRETSLSGRWPRRYDSVQSLLVKLTEKGQYKSRTKFASVASMVQAAESNATFDGTAFVYFSVYPVYLFREKENSLTDKNRPSEWFKSIYWYELIFGAYQSRLSDSFTELHCPQAAFVDGRRVRCAGPCNNFQWTWPDGVSVGIWIPLSLKSDRYRWMALYRALHRSII